MSDPSSSMIGGRKRVVGGEAGGGVEQGVAGVVDGEARPECIGDP